MSTLETDLGLTPRPTVRLTYDEASGGKVDVPVAAPAREVQGRVKLVLGAFVCAFSLLGLRLAHVSFGMEAEFAVARAATAVEARAEVTDRMGRPLAMNRLTTGLAVDGRDVWDAEETALGLAQLFPGIDAARLEARLADGKYAHLLDDLSPEDRDAVVALGLPGMRFPESQARVYPQGALAAHVVGYTIPGRGGAIGVERAADDLNGDATIRLTLDAGVQKVLEDELSGAIETFAAKAGWGILMDVRDGSVLALASLPDFDPNKPGDSPAASRRNRAASDAYELGSAFKPITVAAAMDRGLIGDGERFDVSEPLPVGDWVIEDYSRKAEPLTASEILQYSSNIGTVKIAQRLQSGGFSDALTAFGLSKATRTDLPESRAPLLPARWGEAELATASYGHGLAVSPLSLTAAFGAVVNGGEVWTPRFMKGTEPRSRRVITPETSAAMRIALRRVLTDGTGRNAEARGYHAIGKTATADKPGAGGYDEGASRLVSSFVGAFPGYDPAYVLLVSLDEPQGIPETYGFATAGYTAAPVFRRVVERAAPMLGLMPVGDDVAFEGFVGLRRGEADEAPKLDALAQLLAEAAL